MKELFKKTVDEAMGWHHNDRTESESYIGVQPFMLILDGKRYRAPLRRFVNRPLIEK